MPTDAIALRLTIPGTPGPGCNPNARDWRQRHRDVHALRLAASLAARPHAPAHPITGPALVEARICWERGRRALDAGNAAGALKGLVDGLTDAGYWPDDRQVHVLVTEQLVWSRQDAGQRAAWPQGCVVVELGPMRGRRGH